MWNSNTKRFFLTMLGVILLFGQGCSMKWLQSGGSASDGSNVEGGKLSGLNPVVGGEISGGERLGQGTTIAKTTPGGSAAGKRRAELTKEEAAAAEAGLKDVFFHYDSWTISDDGSKALIHDAAWLKQNPKAVMRIEGHCDERGNQDYNLVLGEKRAKAARGYIIDLGVSPKQIAIVSYGEERPFCVEQAETCYQQNRRGHMLLRTK
jgi:peptidoglycan-associated lipoprotein